MEEAYKIRVCLFILVLLFVWVPRAGGTAVNQTDTPSPHQQAAQTLLERMSVEERVGQLFLVTFQGDSAPRESNIADLILNYRVGGVVLIAQNDNITGYDDMNNIPRQVAELSNDLQRLALLGVSTAISDPTIDEDAVPPNRATPGTYTPVPLFIAVAHEGDGYPNSQIFNGITTIPNNMAIGATWASTCSWGHRLMFWKIQRLSVKTI